MMPLNKKGFTLAEMIIVMAIIGILFVSLYPSLTGYMARANDTLTRSRVKSIASAFESYVIDKDTWIIADSYGGGSGSIDYDPTLAMGPTLIPSSYAAGEPSSIRKLEIGGYIGDGSIPQTNDITQSKYAIYGCDTKTFSIGSRVNMPSRVDTLEITYACNGVINTGGTGNTMINNGTYISMNTAITRGDCDNGAGTDKNCEGLTLPAGGGPVVGDLPPSGYCWMTVTPLVIGIPTYQVGATALSELDSYYDGTSCTYTCGGSSSCS